MNHLPDSEEVLWGIHPDQTDETKWHTWTAFWLYHFGFYHDMAITDQQGRYHMWGGTSFSQLGGPELKRRHYEEWGEHEHMYQSLLLDGVW